MSTDLRLLLDEAVTEPLARAIERIAAVRAIYVRDVPGVSSQDDEVVMNYARREGRIVFTVERAFERYRVCTHPGIIILTTRERHEAMQQEVFQRFIRSGHRQHAKNSLTRLSQEEAAITDHSGETKIYKF